MSVGKASFMSGFNMYLVLKYIKEGKKADYRRSNIKSYQIPYANYREQMITV